MAKVHCIGALVVDALSGPLPHYPVPRVKTQINTASIRFMPGGGAANTGSALAQIGVRTTIFAKVGDDLNGGFLRDELVKAGVDVSQIRISRRENTPFTFVGVHPDGDRSFIHTPGANLSFSLRDFDTEALYDCKFLLYQDMFVLPKLDHAAAKLLAGAQSRGITTLLDECYGLGPKRRTFEAALPYCDVAIPSCDDMQVMYPGMKPVDIARHLRARGAKRVVLKLGARGCLVATEKETALIPSVAKQIVDTTGAGDCFNAGFIAGLVHGLNDLQASQIGAAAAAACIRSLGGAVDIPKYKKLAKVLNV